MMACDYQYSVGWVSQRVIEHCGHTIILVYLLQDHAALYFCTMFILQIDTNHTNLIVNWRAVVDISFCITTCRLKHNKVPNATYLELLCVIMQKGLFPRALMRLNILSRLSFYTTIQVILMHRGVCCH